MALFAIAVADGGVQAELAMASDADHRAVVAPPRDVALDHRLQMVQPVAAQAALADEHVVFPPVQPAGRSAGLGLRRKRQ